MSDQHLESTEIVDERGHKLDCPSYNQPPFTLCTCGAAGLAGLLLTLHFAWDVRVAEGYLRREAASDE